MRMPALSVRTRSVSIEDVPANAEDPKQAAAEACAFFVGPIHKPNRDRRTAAVLLVDAAQDCEAGEHSERAVEPAAVRYRIKMASEDQCARRLARQREPAVSRGVVVMLDGQIAPLRFEPASCFEPGIGPRDSLRAIAVRGQLAQFFQFRDGTFRDQEACVFSRDRLAPQQSASARVRRRTRRL